MYEMKGIENTGFVYKSTSAFKWYELRTYRWNLKLLIMIAIDFYTGIPYFVSAKVFIGDKMDTCEVKDIPANSDYAKEAIDFADHFISKINSKYDTDFDLKEASFN